jgi:hypothetical protein
LLSVQPKVDLYPVQPIKKRDIHVSTESQAPYQQAPYQQAPYQPVPYRQNSGSSWFRIWAVVIGTAVAAALVVLAVSLWHAHSGTAPATSHPSTSTSVPAHPTTPVKPTSPVTPTGQ